MANNCLFEMRIHGDRDTALDFANRILGMGRVSSADVIPLTDLAEPAEIQVWGDCAWSLEAAFGIERDSDSEFRKEIGRLGLSVEAYSAEPGERFQEHYVFRDGKLEVAEETVYDEYHFGEDDHDLVAEVADELEVTADLLPLMTDPDQEFTVAFGGYQWEFNMEPAKPGATLDGLRERAVSLKQEANKVMSWPEFAEKAERLVAEFEPREQEAWNDEIHVFNPKERSVAGIWEGDSGWEIDRYQMNEHGDWDMDHDFCAFEYDEDGMACGEDCHKTSREAYEEAVSRYGDMPCPDAVFCLAEDEAKKSFKAQRERSHEERDKEPPDLHAKREEIAEEKERQGNQASRDTAALEQAGKQDGRHQGR